MKKRSVNIIVGNAGGNAGETSKNYKVSIPTQWVNAMGLSVENRKIEISFDGERIIIEKPRTIKSFLEEKIKINHDVKIIELSENEVVHTKIVADFTDKTLCFENCSDNIIKTAFGVNENPSWADFESFLESRCIPRTSDGI
ncbi:MAG: hypothetical protein IKT89_04045, partial [Clostridia bacterium]|nr:hypothetical protein [Clostridia bacterium]